MAQFPLFELEQYGIQIGQETLLRDVTCTIPEKAVTAILGPERSGKTLLLHACQGFTALLAAQPSCPIRATGKIRFRGRLPAAEEQKIGRQSVVLVVPQVFPGSLFANVAYGLRLAGHPDSDLENRVAECLIQVGLDYLIPSWRGSPEGLSPGQKQQLALARALALEPEMLLLDEPWMGLDAMAQAHLNHLLQSLCSRCTVVVASRGYRMALRIADWLLLLERQESGEGGYFLAAGSPQELIALAGRSPLMAPPSRAVQEYVAHYMRT
ncbi:MAG: ATP-binding cassette domain-containing protein [Thermostichus sp. DG02_5_bins_236]